MLRQRGSSLVENLIALAILGAIAVVFLTAISSGVSRAGMVHEMYTAENLARTQMEDIRNLPYDDIGSYPVTISPSGDYNVSITLTDESPPEHPNTLQMITVTVFLGEKRLLVLESYKAKL